MTGQNSKELFLQIVDGWKNDLFKSEETEKIALERLEVCTKCSYVGIIERIKIIPNRTLIKYTGCTICKCPISKKIRSMRESNDCPKKFWKK